MKTTPSPSWCMFKQVLSFGIIEECRRWRPYPSYNHVPQCLVGLEGEIGQVEIATCAPNTFCVNRFIWRHNSTHKLSVTANRLPMQSVPGKVTCKQNFADSPLILSSSMGPTFTMQWPSSMAAPLIFEKHSRRPHGSCVLWCCLRRTAPTRKTTWFAQGPRVVFNLAQGGFQSCPGRFSILPRVVFNYAQSGFQFCPEWFSILPRVVFNQQCQGYILTIVKELPWRFGYHLRGFCFLRRPTQIKRIGLDILDSPEKKAGKRKTPLSHNQLVQNIHTPFYTQSEMKFDIIIFHFEMRQRWPSRGRGI